MIAVLNSGPWAGPIVIAAIVVIFGIVPLGLRFLLRLLEPDPEGRTMISAWRGRRRGEAAGEWGRDDAGLIASSKGGRTLPHQRGRRPGNMR